jgi:arylformamidase
VLIDISPPVSAAIGVWPGDVPFRRRVSQRLEDGANLALSSVRTTLHVGAHADAPSHYALGGAPIDAQPLDIYFGPCQLISVDVARGARVTPADLKTEIRAPRVLLSTGSFPDPNAFTTDFASLSAELVEHLHAKGVVLVGIDTPSVDPFDDKVLVAHQTLFRCDMANLEGLVLSHVAPGLYTLVALPLRIEGGDAAPVRAALIE